jgi:hypothetical protein
MKNLIGFWKAHKSIAIIALIMGASLYHQKTFSQRSDTFYEVDPGGNLYRKPEFDPDKVIIYLYKGELVKIISKVNDEYYYVQYKDIKGYICTGAINLNKTSRTVRPNDTIQNTHSNVKIETPKVPPSLFISDIKFNDENNNKRIDGNEKCYISFNITNNGKGAANNLKAIIQNNSKVSGLSFNKSTLIGSINPNSTKPVKIPINGTMDLSTDTAIINVSFEEKSGFPPDPFDIKIETKEFIKPNIKVVDYSFLTDNGKLKLGIPIQLKTLIQNVGLGDAENVSVSFSVPSSNVFPNGKKDFAIGTLQTGDSKVVLFEFIANKLYSEKTVPIEINIKEKYSKYGESKQVIADLDTKSSGTTISIASTAIDNNNIKIQVASLTADIDKNIPVNSAESQNRYALIIGNEDYSSYQMGLSTESNVEFAANDAKIFGEYANKTLGILQRNIFLIINATAGIMSQKIEQVSEILSRLNGNGELYLFYSGHGFPDETSKVPYLIPVDVSASNLNSAIKLSDLYRKLAQTKAKRITVFLDACFTGEGREAGLLTERGIKVTPKEDALTGNLIVFSASRGNQSALSYKEKEHGMFTYFLLKKIQETKGKLTLGELDKYLQETVPIESLRINGKPQDPQVNVSPDLQGVWTDFKVY